MHFSIPDTQDMKDGAGAAFKGYNVHINGVFHCTVRFKQLHCLHEQLRKEFGSQALPAFPSKRLLPLTANQLEDRRSQLEKYIQTVGQNSTIVSSELFNGFLLSAQQETNCEELAEVELDVYLMNNYRIPLRVCSTDRSEVVLGEACKHLRLPQPLLGYFCLFLVRRTESELALLRQLQEFESPYISRKLLDDECRIVVRKSYWDSGYDAELVEDPVALHLLYVQTVADVERGWVLCDKETRMQLAYLQARGAKREYVELARALKYYGYLQFRPCRCDYPKPDSLALVSIGEQELNVRVGVGAEVREGSFKVTRMRCWRITALHDAPEEANGANEPNGNSRRAEADSELSFEYLIAKDRLQWITLSSPQAILMSACLQSMVDELLLKKNGGRRQPPSCRPASSCWTYMKRDGSSHIISGGSAPHAAAAAPHHASKHDSPAEAFSVRKLQEKFSSVSFKSGKDLVENHAFEGIGDDDL